MGAGYQAKHSDVVSLGAGGIPTRCVIFVALEDVASVADGAVTRLHGAFEMHCA